MPRMGSTMRLGLIADIHADLKGLEQALTLLERAQVDRIVCAGDLVERGPQGDAVIARILAEKIVCVRGNHDRDVVRTRQAHTLLPRDVKRLQRMGRLLADDSLNFLAALPPTHTLAIDDTRILLAHATPWDDVSYVLPNSPRTVFERVADTANADVVLLGHTHIPLIARVGPVSILNAGSVCGTYTMGSHTCGILDMPECEMIVFDIRTGQRVQAFEGLPFQSVSGDVD
ncbi:MAG: YfcE family phosphodiesterase [Chloroflexi bacterium]|nr:YfcE family phosphodiesterase [Chloroflexota bacterium]